MPNWGEICIRSMCLMSSERSERYVLCVLVRPRLNSGADGDAKGGRFACHCRLIRVLTLLLVLMTGLNTPSYSLNLGFQVLHYRSFTIKESRIDSFLRDHARAVELRYADWLDVDKAKEGQMSIEAPPIPPFIWHGVMRSAPAPGAAHDAAIHEPETDPMVEVVSIWMYPDAESYLRDSTRMLWYQGRLKGMDELAGWAEAVHSSVREELRIQADVHFGNLPWESGFLFEGMDVDLPTRKVVRAEWREELLAPLRSAAESMEKCGSASMVRVSFKEDLGKSSKRDDERWKSRISSQKNDTKSPLMDLRLIVGFATSADAQMFKWTDPGCEEHPVDTQWLDRLIKSARNVRGVSNVTLGQVRDGRFVYVRMGSAQVY